MVKEGYSKINPTKFALAAATVIAGIVLLSSLAVIINIFGGFDIIASALYEIYGKFGYKATYLGALLGTIYTFIDTFILAWIFAWLYNKLIS